MASALLCLTTSVASADLELSTLSSSQGFAINGSSTDEYAGTSNAYGDFNGDGIGDMAVASTHRSDPNGFISVVYGSAGTGRGTVDLSALSGSEGYRITNLSTSTGVHASSVGAGDVNGDGIDDVILSYASSESSSLYAAVVYGTSGSSRSNVDLSALSSSKGYKIDGFAASNIDVVPMSLSSDDVDGDGVEDIAIGFASAGKGAVYVVYGKSGSSRSAVNVSSFSKSDGYILDGNSANGNSALFAGYSVSTGDINGDGIADIVTGAIFADATGARVAAGSTFAVYGEASRSRSTLNLNSLASTDGYRIDGGLAENNSGLAVSAGDINGDGIGDIATAVPHTENRDPSSVGSGYIAVVYGKSGGSRSNVDLASLSSSDGFKISERSDALLVSSRLVTGDFNGDGIGDLAIGAFRIGTGHVFVIYGKVASSRSDIALESLSSSEGFKINGISPEDYTGQSLARGDINGDSITDLLIGANLRDNGATKDAGTTFVVYGSATRAMRALTVSAPKSMRSSKMRIKTRARSGGLVTITATVKYKGKRFVLPVVKRRVSAGKTSTFKLSLKPKSVRKKVFAALAKRKNLPITFVVKVNSDGSTTKVTKTSKLKR